MHKTPFENSLECGLRALDYELDNTEYLEDCARLENEILLTVKEEERELSRRRYVVKDNIKIIYTITVHEPRRKPAPREDTTLENRIAKAIENGNFIESVLLCIGVERPLNALQKALNAQPFTVWEKVAEIWRDDSGDTYFNSNEVSQQILYDARQMTAKVIEALRHIEEGASRQRPLKH